MAGFGFEQGNEDGAVAQCGREGADAGEGGGSKGVESADVVASAFTAVGAGAAFVSGIEETAQFVGLVEIGVQFVEQKGGLLLVNDAEEDGGFQIFGAERPGRHRSEDLERGGFATAAFRGMEVEPRGLVKSAESVSVSTPEGDGNASAGADGEVELEAGEDLSEDLSAVDGFGPGFEFREFDGIGLGIIKELGAASGDQAIEGASAQAEAFGFLEANTVIFDG